eukprot:2722584-Amphidinium_carterae.1
MDTDQYTIYLKATHKPIRFEPHPRGVAESWMASEWTRESLLWKIHRERIQDEDCVSYADSPDDPNPMIGDQVEDEVADLDQ